MQVPGVMALLILDSNGARVAVKYYNSLHHPFRCVSNCFLHLDAIEKKARPGFEKRLYQKKSSHSVEDGNILLSDHLEIMTAV